MDPVGTQGGGDPGGWGPRGVGAQGKGERKNDDRVIGRGGGCIGSGRRERGRGELAGGGERGRNGGMRWRWQSIEINFELKRVFNWYVCDTGNKSRF